MSDFDFLTTSRKLLKQLNWYLLHVAVYLVSNMTLILYIYDDTASRWPGFFIIFIWAIGIILHGLTINGSHPFRGKKKSVILKQILHLGGY